jgi:hypothetical protein
MSRAVARRVSKSVLASPSQKMLWSITIPIVCSDSEGLPPQGCGAIRMMRQRWRRWLSVRKSVSIGLETALAWPVDVLAELLPALPDIGFCVGGVAIWVAW